MKLRRSRRPLRRYNKYKRTVTLRSKLKQERRLQAGKYVLYLAVATIVLYGGWRTWTATTHFFSHAEYFQIRTIEVKGGKNVTQSEIAALLPFRPGDNIFRLWASETENNIQQCKPELRRISIRRGWRKVTVQLEERQPVACVVEKGQRLGLDAENALFPLRGKLVHQFLPEVTANNEDDRREVLAFVQAFSREAGELYPQIAKLGLESVNDIVFEFKDGARVFWGPLEKDQLKPKLKRLEQVMADAKNRSVEVDYINLCYFENGRILVRPKADPVAKNKSQISDRQSFNAGGSL